MASPWTEFMEPWRYKGRTVNYVKVRRRGFCVWASTALESIPGGRVHFVRCADYRMAACGLGNKKNPRIWRKVRARRITCKRCLVLVLLDLNRMGRLAGAA